MNKVTNFSFSDNPESQRFYFQEPKGTYLILELNSGEYASLQIRDANDQAVESAFEGLKCIRVDENYKKELDEVKYRYSNYLLSHESNYRVVYKDNDILSLKSKKLFSIEIGSHMSTNKPSQ
eukprot:NODE_723_length_4789_cov_0.226439.p2 type:complete len:122 gc:universal NODE_723_length_4789_cov_0.226439:4041-3676(-)